MSFFNSLQQYVTSGVAGLGLSPRRFSLSRPEPTDVALQERRESNNSQQHGKFLWRIMHDIIHARFIRWKASKIQITPPPLLSCTMD